MDVPAAVQEEFPFDHRTVPVDGPRMSVVDDGPPGADETLLFVHGNPTWSFLWRNLMGPAVEAGHRVVAPDLIGLGRSEKPLSPAYHNLERHVRNLSLAVEQLDLEDLTIVLHDWGGPIGMGMAVDHPERIRRIVIANTLAFPPRQQRSLSQWHRVLSSSVGGWLGQRLNLVARSAFAMGVEEPLDREVREAYLWPLQHKGARIAARRLVEMVPDGPDHPTARALARIQDGYDQLQTKPMLVLWADKDPVMRPKFADKWAEHFPKAEVRHVSETAGHFWQEDDPEAFLGPMRSFVEG